LNRENTYESELTKIESEIGSYHLAISIRNFHVLF
jgi:hypothetical protein